MASFRTKSSFVRAGIEAGGIPLGTGAKAVRVAPPWWLCCIAGASLAVACGGGYPEPRNQLTASESAVRAAEVAGAQNSPQSALHLKRAREQVENAKALMQEDENERAEWVLRRAQADADLALSLAHEEAQRKKAAEVKEELEQLQESIRQRNQ